MTNFSQKIARIFLLFYCLTPHTYTKCENNYEKVTRRSPPATNSLTGIFAEIERIKNKGDKHNSVVCGAAWIDTNFLITAASCLEIMHTISGKTEDPKKIPTDRALDAVAKSKRIYDVNVILMEEKENQVYIRSSSKPLKGKAKIYPVFRRSELEFSNGMPIAYDVAVVKAEPEKADRNRLTLANHGIGSLCKGKQSSGYNYTLLYSAKKNGTVYEWQLKALSQGDYLPHKDVGYFKDQRVVIDPDQQFTTRGRKMPDEALIAGLPILRSKEASIRCIAGISNFHGRVKYESFITSTKVTKPNIREWIKYTKSWLSYVTKNPKKGDKYAEDHWTMFAKEAIGTYIEVKVNGTEKIEQRDWKDAGFKVDEIGGIKDNKVIML